MSDEDLFNPDEYEVPTGGEGGTYEYLDVAGTYLLGIEAVIEHGNTKSAEPKRFSRFAFKVLDGPQATKSMLDRVYRAPSSYKRLASFCQALRIKERFDPKKDSEMERLFVGRAMKAQVTINENGYAEIKWPLHDASAKELAQLTAWEALFAKSTKSSKKKSSGGDVPGADDFDDAPLDDFGDDSIPF